MLFKAITHERHDGIKIQGSCLNHDNRKCNTLTQALNNQASSIKLRLTLSEFS